MVETEYQLSGCRAFPFPVVCMASASGYAIAAELSQRRTIPAGVHSGIGFEGRSADKPSSNNLIRKSCLVRERMHMARGMLLDGHLSALRAMIPSESLRATQ